MFGVVHFRKSERSNKNINCCIILSRLGRAAILWLFLCIIWAQDATVMSIGSVQCNVSPDTEKLFWNRRNFFCTCSPGFFSVQLCTDCAVVNRNLCSGKMQFFCAQKTKQKIRKSICGHWSLVMFGVQMLTILCHLAEQTQCHTQPVRHRYNVGFKHSILKTLSVLSTSRGTEGTI